MIDVVSVENMRRSDAATIEGGISGRELMRRAGEGICQSVSWRGRVAIVCGSGNNGGDGYVLASLLFDEGVPCTIFLLSERFSMDGRYYYDICIEKGIECAFCSEATDFSGYGTIVDCIFGTGFRGEATGLAASVIEAINRSDAYVVSVDINSGMNGDSGRGVTVVRSDLTVSIGSYKTGHFLNAAKDHIGKKVNCDIGIVPIEPPYHLLEESDLRAVLRMRKHDSNKSTYGYVALVGGSECYSGAIRLATMAACAMRAGAGVVMVAAPRSLSPVILPVILESTFYPLSDDGGAIRFVKEEFDLLMKRVRVIAFGMGIGNSEETKKAVEYLLTHYDGTLVIDADGLNALAGLDRELIRESKATVILTPHPMEFSRISGEPIERVKDEGILLAMRYAEETGAIVLLKGSATVVSDGERVLISDRGCAGMATAGSGDVLSGVLAALCGYHREDPLLATASAAFLCGYAGELAEEENGAISMTAGDTARHVRDAVLRLCEKTD